MKRILFILILLPNLLFAQDFYSKINKLKTELYYLDSLDLEVKTINISPNGNWVLLYEDFGYSYNELPPTAEAHLKKLNNDNIFIRDFDFLSDTSWICISKNNAYAFKYVQQSIGAKVKELNQNKAKIYQIAVDDSKWAIIYNRGEVAYNNLPQHAIDTINTLKADNRLIRYISFFGQDGWLMLYGKNDFSYKNVPYDLVNELNTLKQEDKLINFVSFFNQAWIIVYEKNDFISNF